MTTRELLRQAKIDHYFRHAEECYRMARYTAARRYLDTLFTLDPDHGGASTLCDAITGEFRSMMHGENGERGNGSPGPREGKERTVLLLVDQDEQLLCSFSPALRRHGYRTVGAASYDEAVEALGHCSPGIVVSEINFDTGARGFDLFLWMRTNTSFVNTPFLFHATRLDREVLIAGKRFGVDDFLLKPTDGDVLAAAVARAIGKRKLSVA